MNDSRFTFLSNLKFSYAKLIHLLSAILIIPSFVVAQSWNQLGVDLDGDMGDSQGTSVALSSDGQTMATGAASAPDGNLAGLVRVYTWNGSAWTQKGTDITGAANGDSFGGDISLSDDGDILAISSPTKDLGTNMAPWGRVQVYKWNGSAWTQWGSNLDGEADFENFGEAISLSGNGKMLAVGIPGKTTSGGSTGAVKVYRYDTDLSDTDWAVVGSQIDGDEDFTVFGESISLDQTGATLAVGNSLWSNSGASSNAGQVKVFRLNGSSWEPKGNSLSIFNGAEEDAFGKSISLSSDGNRIAIGASDSFLGFGPTFYGYVQVWEYASESWTQVGADIVSSLDADSFGTSVQISGDGNYLVVGAPNYLDPDNLNGRVEVYTFNVNSWEQVGSEITGEAEFDALGGAVAISDDGSIVALGSSINNGGGAGSGQVRVFEYGVIASNSAPIITAAQSFDVDENTANATSVGTVVATDVDAGTTLSSWSITAGNDDGVFTIDASSGEITIADNTTLDFESTTNYTLTLTVSDGTDTSDPETVTITVNDLNDNTPIITAAQSFSVDENAANSTSVGTMAATDSDAGTTFSGWSITTGNEAGIFAIGTSTGEITIADNTLLDFEFMPSFTLTVTVSDGSNTSASESVEVNLNDLNDNAPVIAPSQTFDVDENTANATTVGTVLAVDGDAGTTLGNWMITAGNDAGVFAINASTGELTVADNTALDYETNPNFTLTLTVSDGTNVSDPETVDITLNDITEVGPTVEITSELSVVTNSNPIPITITFGDVVSGLELTDITVGNGAAGNLQSSDNIIYSVDITPVADGIVTVDIAAGVAQDLLSNGNLVAAQFSIEYDGTAPIVTVSDLFTNDQTPAVSGTVDDPTASVAVLIDGQIYTADINGTNWSIADNVIPTLAEGEYSISVQATDGLNSSEVATATLTIDLTSPEVAFLNGAYTFPLPYSDPVNLQPFLVNIYFGEKTTGLLLTDIAITGDVGTTGLSYVDSDEYYILAIPLQNPDIDQEITISIPAGVITDLAGNPNLAAIQVIKYDVTSPTVLTIEPVASITNLSSIPVTVTFNEAIAGLTKTDFLVTNGAINDDPTSGDNTVFTVKVVPAAEGNVSVQLITDNLTDLAGNSFMTTPEALVVEYDNTAPTVSISSEVSNLTNISPIPVTITFSEEVSVFTAAHITVGNGSASNLQTSDNITFTADITPTADGSVTVDVVTGVTQDAATNNNTAATQFAISYDGTAPVAGIAPSATITGPSGFTALFGFGEEVEGFDLTDISIGNGTASNFQGAGSSYTVSVLPDGNGDVTIDVAAGVTQDLAGNDNTAAQQVIVTLDNTPPAVTITSSTSVVNSLNPISITIDFSEAIDPATFTADDLSVGNAAMGTLAVDASDASLYTASVTPDGEGDITIDLGAGLVNDVYGNGNTAATQLLITYDPPYSGGKGTEADPYLIANEADLRDINSNPQHFSSFFKQTADIELSSEPFIPIGLSGNYFSGHYDGSGHVINNLTITEPDGPAGLFAFVGSATFKNLGLSSVNIKGNIVDSQSAGGLIGYVDDATMIIIERCYVTGQIEGGNQSGGFIGFMYPSGTSVKIIESFTDAKITGDIVGGFIGKLGYEVEIINSYSTSELVAYNGSGGFVGSTFLRDNGVDGFITNSYFAGKLSGIDNGSFTGDNSIDAINNSFWDTETTGISGSGGLTSAQMKDICSFYNATWDFVGESENGTADIWNINPEVNNGYPVLAWQYPDLGTPENDCKKYSGGTGTSDDPYLIANKADLKQLSETTEDWGSIFKQIADIAFTSTDFNQGGDFYNEGQGFKPIGGRFSGVYDGNGFEIIGLTITRASSTFVGLFGAPDGIIKNLTLKNVNILGDGYVAALAGNNYGDIINCHVVGGIVEGNFITGGLVGNNYQNITKCSANLDVVGRSDAGGLLAVNFGSGAIVTECFSLGTVRGQSNVGGLIGLNFGSGARIINSFSHASAMGTDAVGGLAGEHDGIEATNLYSIGQVGGPRDAAGGLFGVSFFDPINQCYWDVQTSARNVSFGDGGYAGKTSAEMKTQSTYAGWDFNNVWKMDVTGCGYPILQWMEGGLECPRFDILLEATDNELLVYPNPSSGKLFLEFNKAEASWQVAIYNISGELVYQQTTVENQSITELDLTVQPAGIYFVKINHYDKIETHKIIIEK